MIKLIYKIFFFIIKKFYFRFFLSIIDDIKINQGIILTKLNYVEKELNKSEFKIFSQWGEDGILQFLTQNIKIENKSFIEFGVENFIESNCRFLLMKDNWSGYVIDGSQKNISELKSLYFYWKYELTARHYFINKSNVNTLLKESNFTNPVGILSIDLDGIDYFILEAITDIEASILICEFNSLFGPHRSITVPYREDFYRTSAHYSNLYWGASLSALTLLAKAKGYALVGINNACNNAFFVKKNLLNNVVKEKSIEEIFNYSKYRESRDPSGKLNYINHVEKLNMIKGMPVFNTISQEIESF